MAALLNEKKDVVVGYFNDGYTYAEIIEMLRVKDRVKTSMSTLKRFFRSNRLYKRPLQNRRDEDLVLKQAISEELEGSSGNLGYRRMHRILLTKGLMCRREDVRRFLLELDPVGVNIRRKHRLRRRKYRSRGPGYVWHIDGHDKIKPYGFSIHGCIDGFSRKLIWLEVGPTNKEPDVIARYYLNAVSLYGCPWILKADNGTEHSTIEPLHIALRSLDTDEDTALSSFSYTTSPQNQRIEAYWSILKKDKIGWWKHFFEDLTDLDMFTNSPILKDCIRFCFLPLIRSDLNSIKNDWNVHLIAASNNNTGPRGRPNTMFNLPHLFDSENYCSEVDPIELADLYMCLKPSPVDVSPEFEEFATEVLAGTNFDVPSENVADALRLYIFLLEKILEYS